MAGAQRVDGQAQWGVVSIVGPLLGLWSTQRNAHEPMRAALKHRHSMCRGLYRASTALKPPAHCPSLSLSPRSSRSHTVAKTDSMTFRDTLQMETDGAFRAAPRCVDPPVLFQSERTGGSGSQVVAHKLSEAQLNINCVEDVSLPRLFGLGQSTKVQNCTSTAKFINRPLLVSCVTTRGTRADRIHMSKCSS